MAKATLGRNQIGKPDIRAAAESPANSVSRAEQVRAEYVVSAGRPAASLVAQGAAGAWVLYRNQFLSSSAQTQISEIRKGASASNLIGMAEALRVPRERIYQLIGLSASTAKRKLARDETLDPPMTERLNRIGAIEKLAEDTFGDPVMASAWLQTSNLGLGNAAPLSLLDTEIGCREVSRVLNAIAYGGAA
jgi:putative toxin-antitoxin system antitoxin component (TIGR02293 family)